MSRSLVLSVASALALTALAPAAFADPQAPRQQIVEQHNLDTYSPEGADALINRLENAAANVCGDRPGPEPVVQDHVTRVCTYETTANAVAQADSPLVVSRYYGYDPTITVDDGYVADGYVGEGNVKGK
ncbi:MAG: UrcA family protein [Hyphomonadaceae bacterium]